MSDPVFIVIPTRNRHETLRHAIRTALAQTHEAIEVIVSDNHSSPETGQVVSEFADPRLRYQRSDRPLCMMDSWEFALSAVRGDGFVHFMGDDNGLVPDAVESVLRLVARARASIVHGAAIQYTWPNGPDADGGLSFPLGTGVCMVNAERALASAYRLLLGFDRLPTINVAFVHTSIIQRARQMTGGRYFAASNPDVFSAVINAMCVDAYVYSNRPFMVNGASRFSNGAAAGKPGQSTLVADALKSGYRFHHAFPPSPAYHFNVYEAFAVAADYATAKGRRYRLDTRKVLRSTVASEFVRSRRVWLKPDIEAFARINGLDVKLPPVEARADEISRSAGGARIEVAGDYVVFPTECKALQNVYEASQFAGEILERPDLIPPQHRSSSLRARLKSVVRERILMGAKRIG